MAVLSIALDILINMDVPMAVEGRNEMVINFR